MDLKSSEPTSEECIDRPYGDPDRHHPLFDLLPLSGPISVLVDPSSACNLQCAYCPTGHSELAGLVPGHRGLMKRELFCKIVDDLTAFPGHLEKLHLYKDGEPLLNPNLEWMISRAKDAGIARSVELTTNGTLLSRSRARMLVASGLDRIRISIQPGTTMSVQDAIARELYFRCLENVRILREERDRSGAMLAIHVKTIDFGRVDTLLESFRSDFGDVADTLHIDAPMGWSGAADFDFTLGISPVTDMNRKSPLKVARIVCPQPFFTLAVHHDGTVSACCVDWSKDVVIGDVRTESLAEIWDGARLRGVRRAHLLGQRKNNRACGNCSYVQGASVQSDLDAHREVLLSRYAVEPEVW